MDLLDQFIALPVPVLILASTAFFASLAYITKPTG